MSQSLASTSGILLLAIFLAFSGCYADEELPEMMKRLVKDPVGDTEATTWFASLPMAEKKRYARRAGQILFEATDHPDFVVAFGADRSPYPWVMMVGEKKGWIRLGKTGTVRLRYLHGDWAVFWFSEKEYHSRESNGKIILKEWVNKKRVASDPPGLWATGKDWRYVGPPLSKYGPGSTEEENAMAAIEKSGGQISVDPRRDEYCVDTVCFPFDEMTPDEVDQTASNEVLAHLKHLTGLRRLIIYGGAVNDEGLVHIQGLTDLEELILTGKKITDAGMENVTALTHLRYLSLSDTNVSDAGLKYIEGLTQLRTLRLRKTKITDAGIVRLKTLNNLQVLGLSHTRITDAGLIYLKGLTELRELDLVCTKVSGEELSQLAHLSKLKKLSLPVLKERMKEIEDLKKALPDCRIR